MGRFSISNFLRQLSEETYTIKNFRIIFAKMKQRISIILSAIILLFSCRGDDNDYQVIDQVLNLYVKSQDGQDLLDSEVEGSYSSVTLLDLLSETALT